MYTPTSTISTTKYPGTFHYYIPSTTTFHPLPYSIHYHIPSTTTSLTPPNNLPYCSPQTIKPSTNNLISPCEYTISIPTITSPQSNTKTSRSPKNKARSSTLRTCLPRPLRIWQAHIPTEYAVEVLYYRRRCVLEF
jgi:hypothetical protein